jgi:hypothetical protein
VTSSKRPTRLRRALLVAIAAGSSACGGDLVCTLPPRPAIRAEIRDSATNAPAAFHAWLIVTNPTVYDSTSFGIPGADSDTTSFSTLVSSPDGKPGTYTVRVRKAGYQLWQLANVRVGGDRCGADATDLQVRLQRVP